MATMISEVYNAFLAGGTPEVEARKAAEALSSENLSTKGDIAEVKEELTRDIAEVKEELTGRIAAVEQKLTRDIAEVKEELTRRIAAVEERLNQKIDAVREELLHKIDAIDKKLTHEIYDIKQGMAVIKTLLLLIIAVQVIPLLKALSVI